MEAKMELEVVVELMVVVVGGAVVVMVEVEVDIEVVAEEDMMVLLIKGWNWRHIQKWKTPKSFPYLV